MINIEKLENGNLRLTMSESDRADYNGYHSLAQLFDDSGLTGNGWHFIPPEEIGALTDGDILSDDCAIEDDGTYTLYGPVYWDSDYQIRDAASRLLEDGEAILKRMD